MRLLRTGEAGFDRYLSQVERRLTQNGDPFEKEVRSILKEVRRKGDKALLYYTKVFDDIDIPSDRLLVRKDEVKEAYRKVPQDFLNTLNRAVRRIRRFHQYLGKRLYQEHAILERGIWLKQMTRPIDTVGIYIPGGKASYPSTVLMAAIPAKVAGVKRIIMVTPPHQEGISSAVLVAAHLAGVDQIYRVGGAQAIASLAYGTETIPRVDKIVGPGNQYVATAKRLVYGIVDVDMVAGPSEIVVISDGKAPASFIASDLISQAEHDQMSMAILMTPSESFGKEVKKEIERQLSSSKRMRIAQFSLRRRGAILIVKNFQEAMALANRIAPEHLELSVSKPMAMARAIQHAGAIFLGSYTPEAIGDYMAGPNHILPTGGTARFSSPLGVEDFIKRTNLIRYTRHALRRFGEDVKRFAEWEGLEGHSRAVQMRMIKR